MAGNIRKEDIIPQAEQVAIEKAFESIGVKVTELMDKFDKIAVSGQQIAKKLGGADNLSKLIKATQDTSKATEELTFNQTELAKQHQELGKLTAKLEEIESNYNKEIIKTREQIKQKNAAIKEEITGEKAAAQAKKDAAQAAKEAAAAEKQAQKESSSRATSYNALNNELNETIRTYKSLTQAERENEQIGGVQLKRIAELDTELKKLDASMGRNQRNVGNYKSAFNGLQFQMQQIAREAPSLAYGPQMFIAAISNNLPMLQDEIAKTREANAKLRKDGESAVPVWKQMAAGLLSWQTAAVVLITTYMLFSKEINAWISSLFKGKQAVIDLKAEQERLNKVNRDAYETGQKELVHVKLLYEATQSQTASLNDKKKAIKELRDNYPDYLGKFSEEEILAGKAGKAYYELANAIMASAKAKAYEGVIAENEVKKFDLENKIIEERKRLILAQNELDSAKAQFKTMAQTGSEEAMIGASNMVSAAKNKVDEYTESINDLQTQISATEFQSKELASKITPTDLTFNSKVTKQSKGNEYTSLEKLQDTNKQALEYLKEKQQEQLDQFEGLESERLKIVQQNNIAILQERNKQIEAEMKLATKEQQGSLLNEQSVNNTKIAAYETSGNMAIGKAQEKEAVESVKKMQKEIADGKKQVEDMYLADTYAAIQDEQLMKAEAAQDELNLNIKNAKKVKEIREKLQDDLLAIEEEGLKKILSLNDNGLNIISPEKQEQVTKQLKNVQLRRKQQATDIKEAENNEQTQLETAKIQYISDITNQGFEFTKQLYDAQLEYAQEAYNREMKAAGDSVEGKILAERKFEIEERKIKRRQAVADKLQAVFSIGLSTAAAIMNAATKGAVLVPFMIALGAAQLATVLAKPIPQYFKGAKKGEHPGGEAIMGELGSELVTEPSGKQWLTDSKPMIYDLAKGSSVLPADKTAQYLQNYSISQGASVFVDMSATNKHLETIAKNTRYKAENHYDLNGRLILSKRGNTTTHYVTSSI